MTTFDTVYNAFFEKMEADSKFFNYFDLSTEEVREVATDRARAYLRESISYILRVCGANDRFSLDNINFELEEFTESLSIDEIDMLACLMYEQNYKREYSKLKAFDLQHVPTSLQIFSPANDRKTLQDTLNRIHEDNLTMLDNYMSRNRESYQSKVIDYDSYASEDSE